MNAKELLKEYPETKSFFLVSDGEAFLEEARAQEYGEHFSRTYSHVDRDGNLLPGSPKKEDKAEATGQAKTNKKETPKKEEKVKVADQAKVNKKEAPDGSDSKKEPEKGENEDSE